jgi:hypothetical protein
MSERRAINYNLEPVPAMNQAAAFRQAMNQAAVFTVQVELGGDGRLCTTKRNVENQRRTTPDQLILFNGGSTPGSNNTGVRREKQRLRRSRASLIVSGRAWKRGRW